MIKLRSEHSLLTAATVGLTSHHAGKFLHLFIPNQIIPSLTIIEQISHLPPAPPSLFSIPNLFNAFLGPVFS